MDTSRAMVTASRRIQPRVENTDMYMWSSVKTWSRSSDNRSKYSGRSWWAMVATDACNRATCDSRAMVTRSRKRRWTRVPTVRRNHVPAVDNPSAIAAMRMSPASCWRTPSLSNFSHNASSESGSADSSERTSATNMRLGSKWNPSLSSRHIDGSAGGRSSTVRAACLVRPLRSDEDVIHHPLLLLLLTHAEALRLQVEHGPVTPAQLHQLVVGT